MNLELKHLWGAPKTWHFDGNDEQLFRGMLQSLDQHSADPAKRSAVLLAADDDGESFGAWNRDGAASLAATIKHDLPWSVAG